ncbi:HIRA-interacting protein 3 [Aplochiton taeniatus]
MVSEETQIRTFICQRLRDSPDLSKLTLAILRGQYLSHVGQEALSPEAKGLMKRTVEEELLKMQDSDNDSVELVTTTTSRSDKQESETEESDKSSDEEIKVLREKKTYEKSNNVADSDSSSLPSLKVTPQKKKKDGGSTRKEAKDEVVVRLKRYVALCGVRRNYKKLFEGHGTEQSKITVLKQELKSLGVKGRPSMEKCKRVRLRREEAQELADLDQSNIISTKGRPTRRSASAWQRPGHKASIPSGSDSAEEPSRGQQRATDWSKLQGIISDDGDSSA